MSELAKHVAHRDERIGKAERKRDAEVCNAQAIASCDAKMADDMMMDALEEARQRLYDTVYAKYGKANPNRPQPLDDLIAPRKSRKRSTNTPWMLAGIQRRRLLPPVQIRYSLSDMEIEADLEHMWEERENLAEPEDAGDEAVEDPQEVSLDKLRGALLVGEHAFERWAPVTIHEKSNANSPMNGDWCITQISPIEVTLRNVDGTRTKVCHALHAFRHVRSGS